MQVKRQWSNIFEVLKEKEINLEFYTKQNCLSKYKSYKPLDIQKLKNSVPADLKCKKQS